MTRRNKYRLISVACIAVGLVASTWAFVASGYFDLWFFPVATIRRFQEQHDAKALLKIVRCPLLPRGTQGCAAQELAYVRAQGNACPEVRFSLPDEEVAALTATYARDPTSFFYFYESFPSGHIHPKVAGIVRNTTYDIPTRLAAFLHLLELRLRNMRTFLCNVLRGLAHRIDSIFFFHLWIWITPAQCGIPRGEIAKREPRFSLRDRIRRAAHQTQLRRDKYIAFTRFDGARGLIDRTQARRA